MNEAKTCGPVQQLILGMLRDLILPSRDFHSLYGDPTLEISQNSQETPMSESFFNFSKKRGSGTSVLR